MPRLITTLPLLSFLAGCSGIRDSRLNPFNWFGRSKEQKIAVVKDLPQVDAHGLVAQIITLKVERLPGGAIIRAMGLPQTQGYWEAKLTPLNNETPDKGTLIYEFRVLAPATPEPVGNKRSREVLVGRFVSDQTLVGVRRITVVAQTNRRTARR